MEGHALHSSEKETHLFEAQSDPPSESAEASSQVIGLKKIPPYWHPYRTMAKGRWIGREILEVVSTEFRDRSLEYYRYALESGVTTLNGAIAKPGTIVQNGDLLENIVHRHEPPVTSIPIKIMHEAPGEYIVIDKPGSIPVHSTGRYHRQSVIEILKNEFGYSRVFPVNRLDRLTSGMMVIALSSERARTLTDEFMDRTIKKEYVARCKGEFPPETIICDEPLLTVDRQMGLNIVHPDGKSARTVFTRMFYDSGSNTSVLHCQPLTGRSHQIRVHLQYLGFPIANDPIYSDTKIWGTQVGKGGLSSTPSTKRAPPEPPAHLLSFSPDPNQEKTLPYPGASKPHSFLSSTPPIPLPRESGEDIGMGSPVPLSEEAVDVITRLRNMKDEEDDWSRWKDVIFRAKASLVPQEVQDEVRSRPVDVKYKNVRKRGPRVKVALTPTVDHQDSNPNSCINDGTESVPAMVTTTTPKQSSLHMEPVRDDLDVNEEAAQGNFCPECYLPLFPDPSPDKLFIYLHALRYTTSLGTFETALPPWASKDYVL